MGRIIRNCPVCGRSFRARTAPSCIARGEGKTCSRSCSTKLSRTGKRSNNWRGGRKVIEHGYVAIYVPGDPHARPDGYALEHRIVMAEVLGRPLTDSEVVHHKNGIQGDNRPENLELLPSQSEHMRKHNGERASI